MGKNNKLLNQMNALARKHRDENVNKAANDMVPQIYAAIALALYREFGFGYVRINRAFMASQEIWTSFTGRADEMIQMCAEETGILLMNKETKT